MAGDRLELVRRIGKQKICVRGEECQCGVQVAIVDGSRIAVGDLARALEIGSGHVATVGPTPEQAGSRFRRAGAALRTGTAATYRRIMTSTRSAMYQGDAALECDDIELKVRSELTDQVRELVLAAGVSDAETDELSAVTAEVAALRARLERRTGRQGARMMRSGFESALEAEAAGEPYRLAAYNGFAIPFAITLSAGEATADFTADARHEGPPNSLHGGVSAWLMDSMLGLVMQARGRRGVTAGLDMRYLARTPLDTPLRLGSRIVRVQGRKVWIEGWIEAVVEGHNVRTVTAEGLFIELADQTPGAYSADE